MNIWDKKNTCLPFRVKFETMHFLSEINTLIDITPTLMAHKNNLKKEVNSVFCVDNAIGLCDRAN